MLSRVVLRAHRAACLAGQAQRHFSATAAVSQTDSIQQLFVDKIRDYAKQSKASGGKLVGATPDVEKSLQDNLDRISSQYGASGPEFLKFPTFNFQEPTVEAPGTGTVVQEEAVQENLETEAGTDQAASKDEKLFWEI